MDKDEIKKEFLTQEISYIDAVKAMEELGYLPQEAEAIVEEWENTK